MPTINHPHFRSRHEAQSTDGGLDFGHEFHGREHHFLLTREALEYLADTTGLDERAAIDTYNAHLPRIHAVAQRLSKTSDALERVVLGRAAFEEGDRGG